MVRKHIIFKGRVQGVGFRFTVQQLALRLGLTGWVRNCYDGSVEACLQGDKDIIEKLIRDVNQGPFIRIDSMDIEELDVLVNEKSFDVKY